MSINQKKILIVSSDYNNLFFKPIIFYLKKELACVSVQMLNKSSTKKYSQFKRNIFLIMMFTIKEVFELIYEIIKFKFNQKKFNYSFDNIDSINSSNFINFLNSKKFDLIVFINCVEIINQETLEKINKDIINFHPGLLPKYRGLFPNFYSLMNNEKNIGFTLHKVNNKIDSGQIIKKYLIPINKKDGLFSAYKKLYFSRETMKFYKECITNYDNLKNMATTQNNVGHYNSFPGLFKILRFRFLKKKS
jgi:folate-dependent phosphoribosylglycinamide formyltransferase PurN